MKTEIKYIELKSGFSHNGPAWIGLVSYSKSGKTIYFDGKAFQRIGSDRMRGNFYDIETGEEYWISGVKKNGEDRHWAGGGKIMLDKNCVEEYLKIINAENIDDKKYIIVEIRKTDKSRFNEIENAESEFENDSREAMYWDNNRKKLL